MAESESEGLRMAESTGLRMVESEGVRKLDLAAKASINIVDLNNKVVMMRKVVRRAKIFVVRALTRKVQLLKNRKGSEVKKQQNMAKVNKLVEEIRLIYSLKADYVSKYSLGATEKFEELICKPTTTMEMRALARLAENKVIHDVVKDFREKHHDWKDLASYLMTKNTSREFKKKKSKTKLSKVKTNVEASETLVKTYLSSKLGSVGDGDDDEEMDDDYDDDVQSNEKDKGGGDLEGGDDNDIESDEEEIEGGEDDIESDERDIDTRQHIRKKTSEAAADYGRVSDVKVTDDRISSRRKAPQQINNDVDEDDDDNSSEEDEDEVTRESDNSSDGEHGVDGDDVSCSEDGSENSDEIAADEGESDEIGDDEGVSDEEIAADERESDEEIAADEGESDEIGDDEGESDEEIDADEAVSDESDSGENVGESDESAFEETGSDVERKVDTKTGKHFLNKDKNADNSKFHKFSKLMFQSGSDNSPSSLKRTRDNSGKSEIKDVEKKSGEMIVKRLKLREDDDDNQDDSQIPNILIGVNKEPAKIRKKRKDPFFDSGVDNDSDGEENSEDKSKDKKLAQYPEKATKFDFMSEKQMGLQALSTTFLGSLNSSKPMSCSDPAFRTNAEWKQLRVDKFSDGQEQGYFGGSGRGDFRGRGRGDFRGRGRGDFRGRGRGDFNSRGRGDFSSRGRGDFSSRGRGEFRGRGRGDFSGRGRGDFSDRGRGDFQGRGRGSGSNRGPARGTSNRGGFSKGNTADNTGPLHPSWEASKKKKQMSASIQAYAGKKITFKD